MWLATTAILWEKVGSVTASRGGRSARSWGHGTSHFLSWIKVAAILWVMLWHLCDRLIDEEEEIEAAFFKTLQEQWCPNHLWLFL